MFEIDKITKFQNLISEIKKSHELAEKGVFPTSDMLSMGAGFLKGSYKQDFEAWRDGHDRRFPHNNAIRKLSYTVDVEDKHFSHVHDYLQVINAGNEFENFSIKNDILRLEFYGAYVGNAYLSKKYNERLSVYDGFDIRRMLQRFVADAYIFSDIRLFDNPILLEEDAIDYILNYYSNINDNFETFKLSIKEGMLKDNVETHLVHKLYEIKDICDKMSIRFTDVLGRSERERDPSTNVAFGNEGKSVYIVKDMKDSEKKKYKDLSIINIPIGFYSVDRPYSSIDEIRQEYPWATDLIDTIAADFVVAGSVRIRPTLIVGRPGTGKTRLASRLSSVLGMTPFVYSASGEHDGAFRGTSRQWSTGRMSVPLQAINSQQRANPLIIIDEIDKASENRSNGSIYDSLLTFLERSSAKSLVDPYLEVPCDLSHVNYVLTANRLETVPHALRDRLRILHMPEPKPEHVDVICRNIVNDLRCEDDRIDGRFIVDLSAEEIEIIRAHWRSGSMRSVRRMVETIIATRHGMASMN